MKNLLITGWVPEYMLAPHRNYFNITSPDEKKENFTMDEVKRTINGNDAIFTYSAFPFQKELVDFASSIKIAANNGVGYDNIDAPYCTKKGIFVLNTPKSVCEPTAEFSIALMLAIARGVFMYDRDLRKKRKCVSVQFFDRDIILMGKTLGILGYGRIGQAVGRKAQGLGLKVIYYDPVRRTPEQETEQGVAYADFEELIKTADVISCHMPYTPENRHIINIEAFRKMKRTAYFVNVARGPIMCEKDLVEALKTGLIRGAATDVFEFEPDVSEELAAIENVIITPHIASMAMEVRRNMVDEIIGGMKDIFEGRRPPNVVNKELFV